MSMATEAEAGHSAGPLHTGGCRCGAVRFEASADPHHVSYCHCKDCRRASGAPVSALERLSGRPGQKPTE